jgi:hypothetical protein
MYQGSSEIEQRRNTMAQAAQAKKIAPNGTVKIDANGGVDNPSVTIPNPGIVKFESETEHSWEIAFDDNDGGYYPMTLLVPAYSSAYLVGESDAGITECAYDVNPLFGGASRGKPRRIMGNNKIIIGGNEGGGKSKRRK